MTRIIKNLTLVLILLLVIIIAYLTFIGISTNKFNQIIEKKIIEKSLGIKFKFDKFKFTLQPLKLNLNIETKNPILIIKDENILIEKAEAKISILSLIINKQSLKKIEIKSKKNSAKSLVKVLRNYENNFQTMILDKSIRGGNLIFFVNLNFDKNGDIKDNYIVEGIVDNLKLEILNKDYNFKLNFNFNIKNNLVEIVNSKIIYDKIIFNSDIIKISANKKKLFLVEGDVSTNNVLLKLNSLPNKFLNNLKFIKNNQLEFESKNKFSFILNKKLKISDLNLKSQYSIKEIQLLINDKIKNQFFNYDTNISILNQKINLVLDTKSLNNIKDSSLEINGLGNILINNTADKIQYSFIKNKKKKTIKTKVDFENNEFIIKMFDFKKKKNDISILEFQLDIKENKDILVEKIYIENNKNKFEFLELYINENKIIQNFKKIKLNYKNTNNNLNKILIVKEGDIIKIQGDSLDGTKLINKFFENNNEQNNFLNIKSLIKIDLKKFFINNQDYLLNLKGSLKTKEGEISDLNIISNFENGEKLTLNIITNNQREQVTNLYTKFPKPLINRYKFIDGFEEGVLDFQSIKKNNISNSLLIIDNFKVKQVPLLAKILTLASLQGIADLLTGEGIRFTDFEMKYSYVKNKMIINEIYAIGPAVSLMLDGYIEKDNFTSLSGTLVPATTINRTIASIPILGDILVGKKVGEGVFGVSFKIKGNPKNLKTTVNPIKTLAPRFITRTLEKIKN